MTVFRTATPSGHSIFCDDLRMESNGKSMYIGIYTGDMLVESFPTILPSFRVIINYVEKVGESDLPIRFVVTLPEDEKVFEAEIPRGEMHAPSPPNLGEKETPLIRSMIIAAFNPLVLNSGGRMRVRAYRGDDEIRLGTLLIRLKSEWEKEQQEFAQKEKKEAAN